MLDSKKSKSTTREVLEIVHDQHNKLVMECLGMFVEITGKKDDYKKFDDSPASA